MTDISSLFPLVTMSSSSLASISAPQTLFPTSIYFLTSWVVPSTTATWFALPKVTKTRFLFLAYAKSTGVICWSLIPFTENLIVFFNYCLEVSTTETVPLNSLLTQYSAPLFTNKPLLGLFSTKISFTISLFHGSIIKTELVPSEVT